MRVEWGDAYRITRKDCSPGRRSAILATIGLTSPTNEVRSLMGKSNDDYAAMLLRAALSRRLSEAIESYAFAPAPTRSSATMDPSQPVPLAERQQGAGD